MSGECVINISRRCSRRVDLPSSVGGVLWKVDFCYSGLAKKRPPVVECAVKDTDIFYRSGVVTR